MTNLEATQAAETRKRAYGNALTTVKAIHTVAWLFFVGCIVAIPVAAWAGKYATAFLLISIVFVEVIVLLINRWRCPLTAIASRYTDDHRDNFDIYLPEWLARHNKTFFGLIYVAGVFFTLAKWKGWLG